MVELFQTAAAAKAIGGAWFVKELFSFFLKLRKQDQARFYRPEEKWEEYCRDKFESINDKVNDIFTAQKVFEVRVAHLERMLKGGNHK